MNPRPPRNTYKALLWDYDYLLAKSDEECCYSLSEREVQLLLAQVDYIGWKTRYSPTHTEIDQDTIDTWSSNLARKLMSGCCGDEPGTIHQYLPDGTYQTSTDDGVTWEDDPAGDPRSGAPHSAPLPGADSDGKRCAAADNVRDQFKVMRDQCISLLTAGTYALAIVAALVALIGVILSISVVGVSFGVILFGLSAALLDLTPEEVAEEIDDDALEQFRCIVYCFMGNDGRMEVGSWEAFLATVHSTFAGFQETFFYSICASLTATGIDNAATIGDATAADCGDCGCGECNMDLWSHVGLGTEIERGDNYVIIEAANVPGAFGDWRVVIDTTDDEICCPANNWAWVGTPPDFPTYKTIPCGRPFTGGEESFDHGLPTVGANVWAVGCDAERSFTIRFNFL